MRAFEKYFAEVEKRMPELKARLKSGADEGRIRQAEKKTGFTFPEELKQLYLYADGECDEVQTGLFGGLDFLPLEEVEQEAEFFRQMDYELTAMGTAAVREGACLELARIPFAFDHNRCFLAVDLSPSGTGKKGQIITVDLEYDQSYLLAESLEEFFQKLSGWLEEGILVVEHTREECYIAEKTGHLFNSLDSLAVTDQSGAGMEMLPEGFWTKRYAGKLQDENKIPVGVLATEKRLLIKDEQISCRPLAHMINLKELILHDCVVTDFSVLAKLPQLQKLILVGCTLEDGSLSMLKNAPALKHLGLRRMNGTGLETLSGIKTLKSLYLSEMEGVCAEDIGSFVSLQELELEKNMFSGWDFLSGMKNLKILNLHDEPLPDLEFLKNLKKLTEFELYRNADQEEGLRYLPELKKLKRFLYPVKEIKVYEGCGSLEEIGFAPEVRSGFEVLSGTKVHSFTVCGKIENEELEYIADEVRKVISLSSFGSRSRV